jgi:hypothetical protein
LVTNLASSENKNVVEEQKPQEEKGVKNKEKERKKKGQRQ